MILMASKLLNCDTREFVPWTPRCRAVLVPPYVNTVCAEWYVHLNFVGKPIEYIHYKSAGAWFIGNRIPVSYRRGSITTFVFIIVKILVWRNCLTHSAQDKLILGAQVFLTATNITTSGAAIEDFVEKPSYRCGSYTIAASMTDKPADLVNTKGFMLFNLYPYGTQAYMIQILIQTTNIWIRDRTNITTAAAAWSTWKKVC